MERYKKIDTKTTYEISDSGYVRRIFNDGTYRILKNSLMKNGYHRVTLNGKHYMIHRLVALYFLDKIEGKNMVNHIDGNKTNNHYSNLEWVDKSENELHSIYVLGNKLGSKHFNSKLTENDVRWIKDNYIKGDLVYGAKNLGRKYNVARSCINAIIWGITWKTV